MKNYDFLNLKLGKMLFWINCLMTIIAQQIVNVHVGIILILNQVILEVDRIFSFPLKDYLCIQCHFAGSSKNQVILKVNWIFSFYFQKVNYLFSFVSGAVHLLFEVR